MPCGTYLISKHIFEFNFEWEFPVNCIRWDVVCMYPGSGIAVCRCSVKKWHVTFVLERNSGIRHLKYVGLTTQQYNCTPVLVTYNTLHTRSLTVMMLM